MTPSRATGAPTHPHEPLTIVHSHPHATDSTGATEHDHMHSHLGDASHDHAHATPGKPGGINMPDVPLAANSRQPGGDTRTDAELLEDAQTFLTRRGVDTARALRDLEHDRRDQDRATRNEAEQLRILAGKLRKARAELDAELLSYRNGWAGATRATVTARHNEAERLRAELRELCCHDPDLIAAVMREA